MKTFGELKEGDKIYIWAGEPINEHWKSKDYYAESLLSSSVYTISKVKNCGFFINLTFNTIIGNSLKISRNCQNEINTHRNISIANRTIYTLNNDCRAYRQQIIITTSEEKWLELINENV